MLAAPAFAATPFAGQVRAMVAALPATRRVAVSSSETAIGDTGLR